MSTYSESLKHPDWQRKRLEIFQRDEWQCRLCGTKEKMLAVHHLCYAQSDWRGVPDKFMLTVCEDCHNEIGGYQLPKKRTQSPPQERDLDAEFEAQKAQVTNHDTREKVYEKMSARTRAWTRNEMENLVHQCSGLSRCNYRILREEVQSMIDLGVVAPANIRKDGTPWSWKFTK